MKPNIEPTIQAKKNVGAFAAKMVENGMTIGLGTGSTAACFIDSLIQRCREGLKIRAVASSERSRQQGLEGGIPFADVNKITSLDLCFDGADEIDPQKRMIKGGGGALLREKIVATMSREMIVLVDEHKLVPHLGKFPLPIEVIPFGIASTLSQIEELGFSGRLRGTDDGQLYVTDEGNYIYDAKLTAGIFEPELISAELLVIPGVVETGIFLGLAGRVLVGKLDGSVQVI